jgi:hypothetical protein
MVLIFVVISVYQTMGQTEDEIRKRTKIVKEQINFANWGSETGKIISGVAITEKILPLLGTLRKVWKEDNYDIEKSQDITYIKIRKWWHLEKEQFEVTMVVCPSFEDAKDYLIKYYIETQREPPLIKSYGREYGLKIGNISFVTTGDSLVESFSSIDFIRHNIIIMMRAEGNIQMELKNMAEALDILLLKKKPVEKFEQLPELPKIKSLSPEKSKINLGDNIALKLEIDNPEDRELHYFWTMTGGGVKKSYLENFEYQGGEEGKQEITVIVVNDIGLYDSKSITIEVVKP